MKSVIDSIRKSISCYIVKGDDEMIFISTMERKDKFKTYRQIIIFFIILEMLGILFNGGIQQISTLSSVHPP